MPVVISNNKFGGRLVPDGTTVKRYNRGVAGLDPAVVVGLNALESQTVVSGGATFSGTTAGTAYAFVWPGFGGFVLAAD